MATYRTKYPGDPTLRTEIWTLTIQEAQDATRLLRCTKGSYWERKLLKPLRRAKRAKQTTVTFSTAHLSTSELSNALSNLDIAVTRAA